MNVFFFQTHISAPFTQDIYMTFYLRTYFNDVNGGRNILINSQLKRSFLWAATIKIETKLRKTEKTWKKKITAMKVKMRYQI